MIHVEHTRALECYTTDKPRVQTMSRFLSVALLLFPALATAAPAAVTAVAYHPQEHVVAFGLQDNVRLFNTEKGTQIGKLAGERTSHGARV